MWAIIKCLRININIKYVYHSLCIHCKFQFSLIFNYFTRSRTHTHHTVKWKRVIEFIWTNQKYVRNRFLFTIWIHCIAFFNWFVSFLNCFLLLWVGSSVFPWKKNRKEKNMKRVSFAFEICLLVFFVDFIFVFKVFQIFNSINPKNNFSCVLSFDKCAWFLFLILSFKYHLAPLPYMTHHFWSCGIKFLTLSATEMSEWLCQIKHCIAKSETSNFWSQSTNTRTYMYKDI